MGADPTTPEDDEREAEGNTYAAPNQGKIFKIQDSRSLA